MAQELSKYVARYSDEDPQSFKLTFKGFLAVRLMEFDYCGKHYRYHGKKLENAMKRLTDDNDKPSGKGNPSAAELAIWGQAAHDWAESEETE